jgi:hypothetical protein
VGGLFPFATLTLHNLAVLAMWEPALGPSHPSVTVCREDSPDEASKEITAAASSWLCNRASNSAQEFE